MNRKPVAAIVGLDVGGSTLAFACDDTGDRDDRRGS